MAKHTSVGYGLLQVAFGFLNSTAPWLADKWAVRLFLRPIPAPYTDAAKALTEKSTRIQLVVNNKSLVGYALGSGPEVICVHGWSGKSTQFAALAEAISSAGLRFIAYDAYGHGANKRDSSNIFHFRDLVAEACGRHPSAVCVVAHSMGAAATALAVKEGLKIQKFVSLGAPVIGEDIIDVFVASINGSDRTKNAIKKACQNKFGCEFDSLAMENTFQSLEGTPILGVHGTDDIDADVSHLDVLKSIVPSMKVYKAKGLGHRRILKDKVCIQKVMEFIQA